MVSNNVNTGVPATIPPPGLFVATDVLREALTKKDYLMLPVATVFQATRRRSDRR